jgi:hypothetical protein
VKRGAVHAARRRAVRLRGLAKHRTFTATAVLSLSLGIGANTGIFTVLRALLLQPLPYAHADRLGHPLESPRRV